MAAIGLALSFAFGGIDFSPKANDNDEEEEFDMCDGFITRARMETEEMFFSMRRATCQFPFLVYEGKFWIGTRLTSSILYGRRDNTFFFFYDGKECYESGSPSSLRRWKCAEFEFDPYSLCYEGYRFFIISLMKKIYLRNYKLGEHFVSLRDLCDDDILIRVEERKAFLPEGTTSIPRKKRRW